MITLKSIEAVHEHCNSLNKSKVYDVDLYVISVFPLQGARTVHVVMFIAAIFRNGFTF